MYVNEILTLLFYSCKNTIGVSYKKENFMKSAVSVTKKSSFCDTLYIKKNIFIENNIFFCLEKYLNFECLNHLLRFLLLNM